MLNLALKRKRHCLKAAMRVLSDTLWPAGVRLEFLRRGVVKHKKGLSIAVNALSANTG